MHKIIPIRISEESKISLRDYLVEQKYTSGWDDWIYDRLKEIAINTKALILAENVTTIDKRKVKFTESDIEKIEIRHENLSGDGITTFTVGLKMYEGLTNGYKIQKFIDIKLGEKDGLTTFEKYINEQIDSRLKRILLQSYNSELDEEKKALDIPLKPNEKQ